MSRFQGKVALVTGGGGGIGSAIAGRLSSQGAHAVVTDVDGESAAAQLLVCGLWECRFGLPGCRLRR